MMTRSLAAGVPMVGLVCLLGCTGKADGGPAPEPVSAPAPAPAPGPVEPRLDAPGPIACTSDLECRACASVTNCECWLAPAGACPEVRDACVRDPCMGTSASCWQGSCKLRPALAGPCRTDAECEVRDDACLCDVFAALVSEPADTRCQGRGCGTRPAKHAYQARCDAAAGRCVLERRSASAPALEAFTLKLACELHGAGISRDTLDVTTSPGMIRFAAEGQPARETPLSASELQPLAAVLASPGFATFAAETPTPGVPHPGMTYCTLDVQSDMLKVDGKRWMTEDTFTPEADAGRRGLHRELAALQTKLPAPAPAG